MANRLRELFNRSVTTGLAAASVLSALPAYPGENEPPPPEQPRQETTDLKPYVINATLVNTLIIEDAAKNALALMPLGKTSYSQQLEDLNRSYKTLYTEVFGSNAPASRIVIIDPAEVAVGVSLGLDTRQVVEMLNKRNGISLDTKMTQMLRNTQRVPFQTPLWSSYKTDASAFSPYITPDLPDCAITPMMAYGLVTAKKIDGLTPVDQVRMLNNHEKWHCLHRDFTLQAAQFNEKTPGEDIFLSQIRSESFADMGMAGDEITSGKTPRKVIDSIVKMRAGNGHVLMNGLYAGGDYSHLTIVALQKLGEEIDKTGVDHFKSLSAGQRVTLYKNISISTAPNLPTITLMDKYLGGKLSSQDAATPTGIAAIELAQNVLLHQPSAESIFDIHDQNKNGEIKERVGRFDPKETLEERAIALSGEITPRSLIVAHAALQSEYYNAMQADDTLRYQAISAKLQAAFVNIVHFTDYIEANQRHNVDPYKIAAFQPFFEEARKLSVDQSKLSTSSAYPVVPVQIQAPGQAASAPTNKR